MYANGLKEMNKVKIQYKRLRSLEIVTLNEVSQIEEAELLSDEKYNLSEEISSKVLKE